jgi:hypothetical protein
MKLGGSSAVLEYAYPPTRSYIPKICKRVWYFCLMCVFVIISIWIEAYEIKYKSLIVYDVTPKCFKWYDVTRTQ